MLLICDLQHSQSFYRSDAVQSGTETNVWRNLPPLWAGHGRRWRHQVSWEHWHPLTELQYHTPVQGDLIYYT